MRLTFRFQVDDILRNPNVERRSISYQVDDGPIYTRQLRVDESSKPVEITPETEGRVLRVWNTCVDYKGRELESERQEVLFEPTQLHRAPTPPRMLSATPA